MTSSSVFLCSYRVPFRNIGTLQEHEGKSAGQSVPVRLPGRSPGNTGTQTAIPFLSDQEIGRVMSNEFTPVAPGWLMRDEVGQQHDLVGWWNTGVQVLPCYYDAKEQRMRTCFEARDVWTEIE
jgi:hypothetical protein